MEAEGISDAANGLAMPHSPAIQGRMSADESKQASPPDQAASPGHSNDAPPRSRKTPRLRPARLALTFLAALFVMLVVGFAGFYQRVERMTKATQIAPADAIIVLTGGYQRLATALDLLKKDRGKRLLISGVHPSINRAELRRATQADPDLFKCCVDLDHAARNTISNATESAKWIRQNGFHSIILVTNNYHIPRSLLEMRRAASGVTFIPYPVVATDIDADRLIARPKAVRVLLVEYLKYVAAIMRGALPPSMMTASANAWDWMSQND